MYRAWLFYDMEMTTSLFVYVEDQESSWKWSTCSEQVLKELDVKCLKNQPIQVYTTSNGAMCGNFYVEPGMAS